MILIHDSITLPGMMSYDKDSLFSWHRKSLLIINRGVNEQFGKDTLVQPALVLCYFCLVLCFRACLFIVASWSHAGKGLTSWLLFVMSNCELVTFPCGILGQVWYLIVLIPDLCPVSYLS